MSRYGPERPPIPLPQQLREDFLLRKPPAWAVYILVLAVIASFIPLALLAKARFSTSTEPRVHFIQDMDNQPRYNTQAPNPVFADGRAMRQPVVGTVARGQLQDDDHYNRGFSQIRNEDTGTWEVRYFQGMPAQMTIDAPTMKRGQTMFGIYCAVCHGEDARGMGPVFVRAQELNQGAFIQPSNLLDPAIAAREDGHIYNTIRNGIRSMPPYGSQIKTEDRWAIVAYIRAMQRSQNATLDDVPPQQRDSIR